MSDPNASFAIEVAATMSGGEPTIAELDQITTLLTNAGVGADAFHDAMAGVTNQLNAAKAATQAANVALGEGQSRYAELEKAALQAAKAEERAALSGGIPPELAAKAAKARGELDSYVETLADLEKQAKSAAGAETELGKQLTNLRQLSKHAAGLGDGFDAGKLKRGLGDLGGPLGNLGRSILDPVEGFRDLSAAMGSGTAAAIAGAAAFAAVVVAVVAVSAALVAGVGALASWGVGLADVARTAALTSDAFMVLNPEVSALGGAISALEGETGVAEAELRGIAKSLVSAKVPAEDLDDALRAAALAERALGKGGASEFISAMKASKQAAGDFSREMQDQLGGIAAGQMMSLTGQTEALKGQIGSLFGGLNIDPVLEGFKVLRGLFDENSASGQTLKFLFETLIQPLIDQAKTAAYVAEALFLGFEIGALKLYIGLKPAIKAIGELFGFEDTGLSDALTMAKNLGEAMVRPIAFAVAVVGALAALLAGSLAVGIAVNVAAWDLMVGAVDAAISAYHSISDAVGAAWDFLQGLDFGVIAANLIAGLVNGITAGGAAVIGAVSSVVGGAISAAKNLLGIHSPSTVFADIGVNTGEGFVQGVDDSADSAQGALAAMVEPPLSSMSSPADRATPDGGDSSDNSRSINLSGMVVNINGVKDAADLEHRFGELLIKEIEGLVLQIGGSPA